MKEKDNNGCCTSCGGARRNRILKQVSFRHLKQKKKAGLEKNIEKLLENRDVEVASAMSADEKFYGELFKETCQRLTNIDRVL